MAKKKTYAEMWLERKPPPKPGTAAINYAKMKEQYKPRKGNFWKYG